MSPVQRELGALGPIRAAADSSERLDQLHPEAPAFRPRLSRCYLDANIHVESDEEALEPLLTEPRDLAAHEIRHVRCSDAKRRRYATLRPIPFQDDSSNHASKFCFRQPLGRVEERQILKHIPATFLDCVRLGNSQTLRSGSHVRLVLQRWYSA